MTIPLSTYQRIGVSAMSGELAGKIEEMKEERWEDARREGKDKMG